MGLRGFALALGLVVGWGLSAAAAEKHDHHAEQTLEFGIRSARSGDWSDAETWKPARVPKAGDRVLVSRGTRVRYDVESKDVIRLVQVVGTLAFARDRDTELNVGLLTVQHSSKCSESGFACDFLDAARDGEPAKEMPQLLIGTPEKPIPAEYTARVRLHYLDGMNKEDAPALVCCGARMEIHGAPMNRTWLDLARDVKPGDRTVELVEAPTGWRVGDEVIVTGSVHRRSGRSFRGEYAEQKTETEERVITKIDGATVTLDKPLENEHFGSGNTRSEVANLSRNVVIESADPGGVRGHTLYHRHSRGGVSYARFAHLGKEGVLGRYSIHFHLVGETMRGSQVLGAAIVDSHNRWITIHGTQYLVVRDCVGYKSVGHGFFLEDGTEVYNLLDRNLGVQAYHGKRLPDQVMPFDPNDGAAFWWANARNSLVRNVSCENDKYGFRYDSQSTRSFDAHLPILMPDGSKRVVDIRTLPVYRFEANEAHTEGLYGVVFAGNNQHGSPIRDAERFERIDQTGPDTSHPHVLRDLNIWQVHYGLRPQIPQMLIEDVTVNHGTYGIYRPMFKNHVYRDIHLIDTDGEPFNRGMDDASAQFGSITVDGLRIEGFYHGNSVPLIQMSDNAPAGPVESHFRNVSWTGGHGGGHRAIFDLGGGARVDPVTAAGVAYYLHDYYGPGRDAKIVSRKAAALLADGHEYREQSPLAGPDALAAEVDDVEFPELLTPVDDLPPATIVTSLVEEEGKIRVRGVSHDNGRIVAVRVNGRPAEIVSRAAGVVDWRVTLDRPQNGVVVADAVDAAGNAEQTGHWLTLPR
jgi:hypothetical protein